MISKPIFKLLLSLWFACTVFALHPRNLPPCSDSQQFTNSNGIKGCCPSGTTFDAKAGKCCHPPPVIPFCPSHNNTLYTTDSVTFRVLCGFNSFGIQQATRPGVDVKDCAEQCAKVADCVSSSWYMGVCYPKSSVDSLDGSEASRNVDTVNRE